ncbi:acylphosphatase-1-like isoform X2 [Crassostrea virginica]|uniref:acylphosphatase n=1 Tax=Crassostrea virginica TaxID=6565 RepID=A0A8B8DT57_CRAVI|nr:acylphosphatase-1-like [Crassostrea virginica]
MAGAKLASFDYEIFGKVQGVFFRRDTKKTAESLELVGWVRNTDRKTVEGTVQGKEENLVLMKKWLQTKGSRKSRIDRAVFKNEKTVSTLKFKDFTVRD